MDDKEIREQAWKYFELHANQRMTLFNFYIQDAEIVYDQHENERLVKLTPPSEIPPKLLKVLPDEDDVEMKD